MTVTLLGGRGEELWPPPGRVLAVGPSHTFQDLAEAINMAFARWDLAHLSMFHLGDGRIVTDVDTAAELPGGPSGPIPTTLDIETAKVTRTLDLAAEFQYTFDLGDDWVHRCVIGAQKVDPMEELGIRPGHPLPYWGWGTIPDQYGRRYEDDDLSDPLPDRPSHPDPMLDGRWPGQEQIQSLDLREVFGAIARKDTRSYLGAVKGRDIDDALQQIAVGIPMALEDSRDEAETLAHAIQHRLVFRQGPGDAVLAEDLVARLRRQGLEGRELVVDLEMLASLLHSDPYRSEGGYVDLETGEVLPAEVLDPAESGLEIDLDEEPERWLSVDPHGPQDGWNDMALFAQRQRDRGLRDRLERAIEGRGAFRRFRDVVDQEGLTSGWRLFSTDREIGRARDFMAQWGIRVP